MKRLALLLILLPCLAALVVLAAELPTYGSPDNPALNEVTQRYLEKGIEEAALAAKRAGVRLRILGDGPDRSALEARHPHVEVLGWSSRETIRSVIRDARALLMPSRYPEPFGLVAAEASRSGLPVILSMNSLLSTEFVQAGLGFACDTRDIESFAATIRHVADMPAENVRAMSERAFSGTVPIATTPSTWRDRLLELYEERVSRTA